MALVCDIESSTPAAAEESGAATAAGPDNDLEDGEIEDDDAEDEIPPTADAEKIPKESEPPAPPPKGKPERGPLERGRHERVDKRGGRHEEKKKHMTEAEKSILHLRKRERMQREKWEKYRKEQNLETPAPFPAVDDFAINIEKAIASVLKKDKHASDEEKEPAEEKRGRKRKNRDKERQKGGKQRKLLVESPKLEDVDDSELFLGLRGPASPKSDDKKSLSPGRSEESLYDSEYSSDRSKGEDRRERKRDYKKGKGRNRDRTRKKSRERRGDQSQFKDQQGVCVFFLQGKCQKNDCPYSHEAMPPMKLELCKFYLKDCCAKGEKCSYMHSEFPCKFYHTGLVCLQGDNCKFDHGGPLDEHRRQILFKHIETAPREILGGFPRMSREEALNKINVTQQNLIVQYGGVRDDKCLMSIFDISVAGPMEANSDVSKPKHEKIRNRPSRWQDPDPIDSSPLQQSSNFPPIKPFVTYQDQDMRVNSNGDIDMRTLPPMTQIAPQTLSGGPIEEPSVDPDPNNFTQDIDIRNPNMLQFDTKDVDIRMDPRMLGAKDVDIRQIPPIFDEDENRLQIDTGEKPGEGLPVDLPKTQRELYMRIQSQQKTNLPEPPSETVEVDENINWYSDDDDDDDNRLTIKVDLEEEKKDDQSDSTTIMSPPHIKPQEVVDKLGDLSKIDISAEVTKLLTSMSQQKEAAKAPPQQPPPTTTTTTQPPPAIRDPRQQRPQKEAGRRASTEQKISIYEQGSITADSEPRSPDEVVDDFRGRPDVDLRNLHLPFKGMLNYTPAKEIDASVNSHLPMTWKVEIVEIPRPDYTGLKLNVQDAEKTGDPRLKKIFRLSTEEKDSPASPKASPKATTVRIDPRLKKIEDTNKQQQDSASLTYNQQLNILQSSAFFQSLTSNQKLLLNQELAARNDPNGFNDPILSSMLSSLNLIPSTNMSPSPTMGTALNILSNVNKLSASGANSSGPMIMRQGPNMMNQMVQPGLLGAAPGIPNIPGDFPPMNFDPRNMNMNSGPQFGNNFDNNFSGGGFDDYYAPPQQDNFGHSNRDNRNFNRDRRRGRNNFNRNNGNRNFRSRNSRNNHRGHTPP